MFLVVHRTPTDGDAPCRIELDRGSEALIADFCTTEHNILQEPLTIHQIVESHSRCHFQATRLTVVLIEAIPVQALLLERLVNESPTGTSPTGTSPTGTR